MGLHNKFPSYFYKRGNLFNTYLSHTDSTDAAPERPTRQPRPTKEKRKREKAAEVSASYVLRSKPRPYGDIDGRFTKFVRENLSPRDCAILTASMAGQEGVELRPDPATAWGDLAECLQWVAVDRKEQYLGELMRRKAEGLPLLRQDRVAKHSSRLH